MCVGLTNTGLWLRRQPGEPCEGREGNPQDFPLVSHNQLLISAVTQERLGRKGISSPSPHTMAHVDGFPGSEVLCPDQVRSCVHSPWGLPSAQHLDIKPGSNPKTHKPTSTPAWLCFPDGYQTFIKPGSNPQTHSHFLAWLCFTSSISNLDQPPNPQPLQPGSSSPALFLQRQKAQTL